MCDFTAHTGRAGSALANSWQCPLHEEQSFARANLEQPVCSHCCFMLPAGSFARCSRASLACCYSAVNDLLRPLCSRSCPGRRQLALGRRSPWPISARLARFCCRDLPTVAAGPPAEPASLVGHC